METSGTSPGLSSSFWILFSTLLRSERKRHLFQIPNRRGVVDDPLINGGKELLDQSWYRLGSNVVR